MQKIGGRSAEEQWMIEWQGDGKATERRRAEMTHSVRRFAARTLKCALALVALVLLGTSAYAQRAEHETWGDWHQEEPATRNFAPAPGTRGLTAEKATSLARQHTGGRVLSATPDDSGGYRVRVLTDDGRVTTVRVSGSGRVKRAN